MDSAQRSVPRRFVGWVWDTNHDDQVPTVIHSVLVSAMIIAVPFGAESVLSAVGIMALLAALAVGMALAGMGAQDSPAPADCECHPAYHELGVHAPGWVGTPESCDVADPPTGGRLGWSSGEI